MYGLHQAADQLVHIEADTLHVSFDHPSAVLEHLTLTVLLVLGPAGLLSVGLPICGPTHQDGSVRYVVGLDTGESDFRKTYSFF